MSNQRNPRASEPEPLTPGILDESTNLDSLLDAILGESEPSAVAPGAESRPGSHPGRPASIARTEARVTTDARAAATDSRTADGARATRPASPDRFGVPVRPASDRDRPEPLVFPSALTAEPSPPAIAERVVEPVRVADAPPTPEEQATYAGWQSQFEQMLAQQPPRDAQSTEPTFTPPGLAEAAQSDAASRWLPARKYLIAAIMLVFLVVLLTATSFRRVSGSSPAGEEQEPAPPTATAPAAAPVVNRAATADGVIAAPPGPSPTAGLPSPAVAAAPPPSAAPSASPSGARTTAKPAPPRTPVRPTTAPRRGVAPVAATPATSSAALPAAPERTEASEPPPPAAPAPVATPPAPVEAAPSPPAPRVEPPVAPPTNPTPATVTPPPAPAPAGGTPAAAVAPAVTARSTAPRLISGGNPAYPAALRSARIGGTVAVTLTVDSSGRVRNVQATSGPQQLRAAAEAAVLRWRYDPATLNGAPVASDTRVSFSFDPDRRQQDQ